MKKAFLIAILSINTLTSVMGQCAALFSFAANFETVNFLNQSNIPSAHYFWNFGDGTGSNLENPIHKFPETGNYFVTLFAKDTMSNCNSYYEYWVNVNKFSTDSCQPISIIDSVFIYNNTGKLQLVDNSLNCNNYITVLDGGGSQVFPPNWWLNLGPFPGRYVSRVRHVVIDTILNGYVTRRAAYKSCTFRYSSAKNYGDCSANFEFKVVSQNSSGQRILFKAMNQTAAFYEWRIVGFGNPIISNNDTVSQVYPTGWPNGELLWRVILTTTGSNGCIDSLSQNIQTQFIGQTITGVKKYEFEELTLNLHPNPTKDVAIITCGSEIEKLTLMNSFGEEILVLIKINSKQKLDLSDLPAGIYFLKAQSGQRQGVFKVLKE